ncbi:uncharacterized protein [Periplaneta americana]|uniref:uncharacterized protein isoform X2 n=1 Tax=Periplaneta americana TaxID=6978 RepID=UPI0037E9A642
MREGNPSKLELAAKQRELRGRPARIIATLVIYPRTCSDLHTVWPGLAFPLLARQKMMGGKNSQVGRSSSPVPHHLRNGRCTRKTTMHTYRLKSRQCCDRQSFLCCALMQYKRSYTRIEALRCGSEQRMTTLKRKLERHSGRREGTTD